MTENQKTGIQRNRRKRTMCASRPLRRSAAAVLAAVLALSFPGNAWAEKANASVTWAKDDPIVRGNITGPQEPGDRGKSLAELNGYSEERWAELNDNDLTYEEIDDLVHSFNPTIVSAWSNLTDNIDLLKKSVEKFKSDTFGLDDLTDDAKKEMTAAIKEQYTAQAMAQAGAATQEDVDRAVSAANAATATYVGYYTDLMTLDLTAYAMNEAVNAMNRKTTQTNRAIRQAERSVSAGVKQMMIAYNSLKSQREVVAYSVQMYGKLLADAQQKLSLGTATQLDVSSAEAALLQAQSQLSAIDANLEPLRKNLILFCGWKEDANPEIGATPASDLSRIDAMNPETDIEKARNNNASLISFRHESHTKSSSSWAIRANTEDSMDETLLTNLRALYQDILADKAAYEAAQSGMKAVEMAVAGAELRYQMGLLTTADAIGLLLQYQSAKTTLLTADSTLFQAMETYDLAVKGNLSAE